MLNYKETVNSIYGDENVSFNLNTDQCDCGDSSSRNPHHKHIITGNLPIIKKQIRKTSDKGSKL